MNNSKLSCSNMLFIGLLFISYSCQNNSPTTAREEQVLPQVKSELEQKLGALFSDSLLSSLNKYEQDFANLSEEHSIAKCYEEGLVLRDKLIYEIGLKIENDTTEQLPDLFWLKDLIPAYTPQVVAEGSTYYLFNNYKKWQEGATKSVDKLDDAFIALQLELFPEDSIEYFYPAYFLQMWDYGGCSLLGRGIHRQILDSMERNWGDPSVVDFRKEINNIKEQLLRDIVEGTDDGYWETKDAILNELAAINSQEYKILNSADKIALKQRFKQFQEADKNNILVNGQSGNQ